MLQKSVPSARGTWAAQDFVIETHDSFPRKMVFSVFGEDRLQRFNIQVGQEVNVSFDIDAREYNGRWFNSIRAFDVRQIVANAAPVAGDMPPFAEPAAAPAADPFSQAASSDSTDDLPF